MIGAACLVLALALGLVVLLLWSGTDDDTDTTTHTGPPPPQIGSPAGQVTRGEWDELQLFVRDANRDRTRIGMDDLREQRTRALEFLALVATFPKVPKTRAVEDLLLDEIGRIERVIASRLVAGLPTRTHGRVTR